jgi:phytoene dehydrogenase-like protein
LTSQSNHQGGNADCIIIGAGHNGLVAANYLARAGRRVVVLERRDIVGGACVTEELFPGRRIGSCAYICHILQEKVIDDLELRAHGFQVFPLDPAGLLPFPDGSSFFMWHEARRTAEEIAPISKADARAWPEWTAFWERAAGILKRYFLKPPPTLAEMFADVRGTPDERVLETLLTVPVKDIADRMFETDTIKAAAVGTTDFGQIDAPGSALPLAYMKAGLLTPHENYGLVRGGMGGITQAMARSAQVAGVTVRTGADVRQIIVKKAGVRGVQLTTGEIIESPVVLSNADPKRTFLHLVPEGVLRPDFTSAVRRLKTRSASLKLHATLKRLPDFSRYLGPDYEKRLPPMVRINPSLDNLLASWGDAQGGIPTRHPLMQVQIPTVLDDTLAPPGGHVMSVWVTFEPPHLKSGSWADVKRDVGEGVIAALEPYAPDVRECIEEWDVFTPEDIESRIGMTDGNIRHLDLLPAQMLSGRPLPGWSSYRTPVKGLYLCGAGTHPGGEVTGAPGHNAAQAVLEDRRG